MLFSELVCENTDTKGFYSFKKKIFLRFSFCLILSPNNDRSQRSSSELQINLKYGLSSFLMALITSKTFW